MPIFLNSYGISNTAISKTLERCYQFLCPYTPVNIFFNEAEQIIFTEYGWQMNTLLQFCTLQSQHLHQVC